MSSVRDLPGPVRIGLKRSKIRQRLRHGQRHQETGKGDVAESMMRRKGFTRSCGPYREFMLWDPEDAERRSKACTCSNHEHKHGTFNPGSRYNELSINTSRVHFFFGVYRKQVIHQSLAESETEESISRSDGGRRPRARSFVKGHLMQRAISKPKPIVQVGSTTRPTWIPRPNEVDSISNREA
jgi:hypothetical protein